MSVFRASRQRRCRECGAPMRRLYGFIGGRHRERDPRTGTREARWVWACPQTVNWWNHGVVEFYERTWHDFRGIPTSGARQRLQPVSR